MNGDPLITYRRKPGTLDRPAIDAFAEILRRRVARGREFHCLITGDAELQTLNRTYRGKDYPTDVLSFEDTGDIAISLARARAQAKARGHSTEDELRILMLHALLHLKGMDHETDEGRMAKAESRWRTRLGLPGHSAKAGLAGRRCDDIALIVAIPTLFALVILFTTIQTFYLEGMRLRTKDVPSLQFFKTEFEPTLNVRSEAGALTFSLWKHTCLIVFAILVVAKTIDGEPIRTAELIESIAVTWLAMMFCSYLIPQLLYQRTSGHWLNTFHGFFLGAVLVARPIVATLDFLHSLIDIVKQEPLDDEPATPAENIEALISAGAEEGLIQEDDRRLIQSVVAFGDKVVREVMTPRPNIVAIQADETLAELHELVVNEQYSRIPVFQSSIDDIAGFVHVRDMFEVAESSRETRKVRELMRPVRLVPETKPVDDLMREMQQEGAHMVIVIDEYGNTAGLASMEDLLEVILGEIRDEHEPTSDVTEDGRGGYIVSGNFDLVRVSDMVEFHPDDEVESTTIGGLLLEWLGRVPKPGESIERDGIRVEVMASDDLRVEQVRISPVLTPSPAEQFKQ